jgi:hypothetical protein
LVIVLLALVFEADAVADSKKTKPAPLNKRVLPPGNGWWCFESFLNPKYSACMRDEATCAAFADIDRRVCFEQKKVWLFTFLLGDDELEMFFAFPSAAKCKTARREMLASEFATRASSCKVVGKVKGRKKPPPTPPAE